MTSGIHLFDEGDLVSDQDGRVGIVRRVDTHQVVIRTFGTFPERLVVEQGDPAWWNEGQDW
jgi:hypothetical protein